MNLFQFQWHTFESGFQWTNSVQGIKSAGTQQETKDGFFLVPKRFPDHPIFFSPLEVKSNKVLFEEFSKLGEIGESEEAFKEAVVKFANHRGLLTARTFVYLPGKQYKDTEGTLERPMIPGESLAFWHKETQDMRLAYLLWHYLDMASDLQLGGLIRWQGDFITLNWKRKWSSSFPAPAMPLGMFPAELAKAWKENWGDIQGQILVQDDDVFSDASNDGWTIINGQEAIFPREDVRGPAKFFLMKIINGKLAGQANPIIGHDSAWNLRGFIMPSTLLAAMWFQLFQAATGQKTYTTCDICNNLIELDPKSRSNKRVHTNCSKRKWKQKYDSEKHLKE